VAIAVVVFAIASLTHANEFLAAFAAGVAVGSIRDPGTEGATELDESIAELLKLAALLVFGAILSPDFIAGFSVGDYVFVVAALVLARAIALAGTRPTRRERLAAAWFGPKGFASVVCALLVLHAGLAAGDEIFHLAGVVVALSIIAHSSTDLVVARWFESREDDADRAEQAEREYAEDERAGP
jgi:NhaP-type Na+/H+ or K+/H+ antiporter